MPKRTTRRQKTTTQTSLPEPVPMWVILKFYPWESIKVVEDERPIHMTGEYPADGYLMVFKGKAEAARCAAQLDVELFAITGYKAT